MKQYLLIFFIAASQPMALSSAYSANPEDPLSFSPATIIYTAERNKFAQIESSGRRSIAASGNTTAVVWTVSSSSASDIFVSFLGPKAGQFSKPIKVNAKPFSYEPTVTGVSGGKFLVGWEADGQVWLRVVSPAKLGAIAPVGAEVAKQISVDSNRKKTVAAWAQGPVGKSSIHFANVRIDGHDLSVSKSIIVDKSKHNITQQYPVVEITTTGSVIAWEDRREGATRIVSAFSQDGSSFGAYSLLNQFSPSPSAKYGRGSGAMRVALASNGDVVMAAWLDKRNWRSGYDVFTSYSLNGGKTFSADEQAQDQFGEHHPQWHASVAIHPEERFSATAWDDARNETSDILYSLKGEGDWSDDFELPGGDGPGRQSHPSIVFDGLGRLHVVWQSTVNGVTSIYHTHSKLAE